MPVGRNAHAHTRTSHCLDKLSRLHWGLVHSTEAAPHLHSPTHVQHLSSGIGARAQDLVPMQLSERRIPSGGSQEIYIIVPFHIAMRQLHIQPTAHQSWLLAGHKGLTHILLNTRD